MKKDFVIGVLGGMGTFATIHLFQQYAEVFEAEKEWDRPRMIIDNRCTMPSRVRSILYDENTDLLISELTDCQLLVRFMGLVTEVSSIFFRYSVKDADIVPYHSPIPSIRIVAFPQSLLFR